MIKLEISKRLNIRVDSSARIGSGHFQRCLAVAQEARHLGVPVRFLYSQLDNLSGQALVESGFEFLQLYPAKALVPAIPSVEAEWSQADQESDAKEVLHELSSDKSEYILLDHYGLGDYWVRMVVGQVGLNNLLIVKDDINRFFSAKSLHLGFASPQDLAKSIELNRGKKRCDYLSSYFPISQSVRERRQANNLEPESLPTTPIRKVLLYLGNSDVSSHIERILLAIEQLALSQVVEVSVLSSFHAAELSTSDLNAGEHSSATPVSFDNQKEYLDFVTDQDLVIGAGGVSSLERLYLGVPQIVFAVAENQIPNATALADWGVLKWAGDLRHISIEDIKTQIISVLDDPGPLRQGALRGRLFIDGLGARRLLQTAVAPEINHLSIRVVRDTDSSTLFCWANDPESRRLSLEKPAISPEEHMVWFLELMGSDSKTLSGYIVEHKGCPVGQIRFQLEKARTYNISYGLDRPFRGLGLSATMVSMGLLEHKKLVPEANYSASVDRKNFASLRTLESLNFKRVRTTEEIIVLSLDFV
jgi:spore coat polysaccharide biosynthesis predicted glycosyltransferase SpsG/RimJ/RimL family protein N-acetyltransferase